MIVRNEEEVLDRCLASAAGLVDEIIIVDTGSVDRTKEIAGRYTDKIYDFPWTDDFSAARNAAFDRAGCDYCMWMDADDVLKEQDRKAFLQVKNRLGDGVDVVMMRYNTGFDENGNVVFSYYRERIVKNHVGMRWKGAVHEVIETRGNVIYSECAVTHWKQKASDPGRNLRIYEKMRERGEALDPRQQYYYGRELFYHGQYEKALSVLEGFLSDKRGWLENKIEACRVCADCWYGLNQEEKALEALLRSFSYDLPRAEICCDVARHFFDRAAWMQAAYWYRRALSCERRDERGGFVLPDAYGYTPCIQLCVCYSKLGRDDEAEAYNERAAAFKPDSAAVAYNRAYFASLRK